MILLDANVCVALIDEKDELNRRAVADIAKFRGKPLGITESALSETCYLRKGELFLDRIIALLEGLNIQVVAEELRPPLMEVLEWMLQYKQHEPDWTDAQMAVISSYHRHVRVWTYDQEFRTIWRRLDGSKIPMAVN